MGFPWLGRNRQREEMIDTLYAKAVAQARQPVFYAEREVPDTVDGRFDYLRDRLGIDKAVELRLPSEFDFARQTMMYLPPKMPDRDSPGS